MSREWIGVQTPHSNRGVTFGETSEVKKHFVSECRLDWFEFTTFRAIEKVPFEKGEDLKPATHYFAAQGIRFAGSKTEARLDVGSTHQGARVRVTGKAMSDIWGTYEMTELVEWMRTLGGKPTRLDFCIDVINDPSATPESLVADFKRGKLKTPAKTMPDYGNHMGNDRTLYFGSKKSERFLRVYNKSAEMSKMLYAMEKHGLIGESEPFKYWTRIEGVVKQDRAVEAWKRAGGLEGVDGVGRGVIRYMVPVTSKKWFNAALRGASQEKLKLPKPVGNKQMWYMSQVLPSLEKIKLDDPDVFAWFCDELEKIKGQ